MNPNNPNVKLAKARSLTARLRQQLESPALPGVGSLRQAQLQEVAATADAASRAWADLDAYMTRAVARSLPSDWVRPRLNRAERKVRDEYLAEVAADKAKRDEAERPGPRGGEKITPVPWFNPYDAQRSGE